MKIPASLEDTLEEDVVAAITAAIAPPAELRLQDRIEIEIESEEEGTFVVVVEDGEAYGEEGLADEPFVAVRIPEAGWPLVQRVLSAWCQGFPGNPQAAGWVKRGKQIDAKVVRAALDGLEKIKDLRIDAEVRGVGTFAVARPNLDEATRVLAISLDEAAIDRALGGDTEAIRVKPTKGTLLATELITALGPVLKAVKGT